MKVGVVYTEEVHNACYRALWPADAFRGRGRGEATVLRFDPGRQLNYASLLDCDVVHIYRKTDKVIMKLVDELRSRGVAITFDNDDDIRLAPKEAANYRALGGIVGERDFRTQVNMMRRAHVVTTTTEVLAERWREVHDGVIEVIPNHVAGHHFVSGPPRNDDSVVIGWFAGREHEADAQRLRVTETLQRVMARCPEVRVVTIGVRLNLDESRYTHHKYIPLHELFYTVRQFDIGIAPIADIPMSYARSDIKVKEYAAAGVPWAASARGSYAAVGPKRGGILVNDGEWEEALVALAESSFRRTRLRRQGRKWAKAQHIERHVERWEAVWREAIEIAAASTPASRSGRVPAIR